MSLYEKFRIVPKEAQKPIPGGRLKGMTDINPMWRIKVLTDEFGPCGTGWKYEILRKEIIEGGKDEQAAFVDINLYYRLESKEWSEPIPGTGGSMFVSSESRGLYTNDECFKMALTDAISVAGKALGVGADIYFAKDRTKYTSPDEAGSKPEPKKQAKKISTVQAKALAELIKTKGADVSKVMACYKVNTLNEMTIEQLSDANKVLNG